MKKSILDGTAKRHPDGFGFFVPDDPAHPDVYIPKHEMTGIMTNDRVQIEVHPEPGGDRFRAVVQKILERGNHKIVGAFVKMSEKEGMVGDESHAWGANLHIPLEFSKGAQQGELVACKITHYPEKDKKFQGEVIEVIGSKSDPLNDTKRVIYSQGIPTEWSHKTLEEVKKFDPKVHPEEHKKRRDLREKSFITIDGATAKDFDDAIYVETDKDGFHLWVAIADVSHYVKPGTSLDKDAYERGNSSYFPNYVVPMLPEILSNELCSLKPNVPRLSMVAEMHFDYRGEKGKCDFYEAIIESKARVTYGEAQEVIDGFGADKLKHVEKEILRAKDLAKLLMGKRFAQGSLDLEIPETEIVLDAGGFPIDLIRSERIFAHRLIEEMMLAANVAVAEFLMDHEMPAVYRVHDNPDPEKLKILETFLHNLGSKASLSGGSLQKKIGKALDQFMDKPEGTILSVLTLRSMKQAQYSPENRGHFGLGFDCYTHFTSPIRRYPDLIVHRALKAALYKSDKYPVLSEDYVATAGTMLSATEQRSAKAERQFKAIKRARFMSRHLGREFEGIVSSLTKFGIFVLLRQFDVDGLIRMESLGNDRFEFDDEHMVVIGKRTGQQFRLGDVVRIQVARADTDGGMIDFALAGVTPAPQKGELNRGTAQKKHPDRKHAEKRKSSENDRRDVRKSRVSKHSRKSKAR